MGGERRAVERAQAAADQRRRDVVGSAPAPGRGAAACPLAQGQEDKAQERPAAQAHAGAKPALLDRPAREEQAAQRQRHAAEPDQPALGEPGLEPAFGRGRRDGRRGRGHDLGRRLRLDGRRAGRRSGRRRGDLEPGERRLDLAQAPLEPTHAAMDGEGEDGRGQEEEEGRGAEQRPDQVVQPPFSQEPACRAWPPGAGAAR
jgi:hypothetical protein